MGHQKFAAGPSGPSSAERKRGLNKWGGRGSFEPRLVPKEPDVPAASMRLLAVSGPAGFRIPVSRHRPKSAARPLAAT